MRTIEQAIQEETMRYVSSCAYAAQVTDPNEEATIALARRMAHIHRLAIQRLRRHVVTDHEAVCAATPTVHAYADLDGYSR